jgi:hypothetical protein
MLSSRIALAAALVRTLELLVLALPAASTLPGRSRGSGLAVAFVFISIVAVSIAPPASHGSSSGGVVISWRA